MILLTGITGQTGKAVLGQVKNMDVPVRAIVRNLERADEIRDMGIEVITGDITDDVTLTTAMQGIDRAFILMANVEGQADMEIKFIKAAMDADVNRLIKLSAVGADASSSVIFRKYHGQSEEYLKQSGLTYTVIRPNFYMDNMIHCATSITSEDKFYLPMGQGQTGMIDIRDVAQVIVACLTEEGHENITYEISGPELLSFEDVAERFNQVLGRKINYVDIAPEEFRSQLLNWGTGAWYVDAVLDLFESIAQGSDAEITDTFRSLTGNEPCSLTHFIGDYSGIFTGE